MNIPFCKLVNDKKKFLIKARDVLFLAYVKAVHGGQGD